MARPKGCASLAGIQQQIERSGPDAAISAGMAIQVSEADLKRSPAAGRGHLTTLIVGDDYI